MTEENEPNSQNEKDEIQYHDYQDFWNCDCDQEPLEFKASSFALARRENDPLRFLLEIGSSDDEGTNRCLRVQVRLHKKHLLAMQDSITKMLEQSDTIIRLNKIFLE